MGNIHLVTGFAGHQHITSADQAVFNSLMFGSGQYVLTNGNQFAASIVTNNRVNVLDGDILMQGRHIRLNEATSVDLTIENGTQGCLRNDLIVVRYTKDENTGIEDANLVVIKGTAAESDPADPAYTSGDLVNGNAILNDMPLYRVQLDGLNISALVPLFEAVDIGLINHASRHATGGNDPITPEMIGAASKNSVHLLDDRGTLIPDGANLDDYIAPGNYYVAASSNAAKITNSPTTASGFRLVVSRGYGGTYPVRQTAYVNTSSTEMYRSYVTGGWSEWKSVPTSNQVVNKSGDTMTGNMTIKKDTPLLILNNSTSGAAGRILGDVHGLSMQAIDDYADASKRRHINLMDSTNKPDIKDALAFVDVVNGKGTLYPILHTGNINSLYPAANVVTGSYVGTGTSGKDSKNSVVLPGEPALFIVGRKYGSGVPNEYCAIRLHGSAVLTPVLMAEFSQDNVCVASWDADSSTLEWYAPSDNAWQMNHLSQTYVYIAIY